MSATEAAALSSSVVRIPLSVYPSINPFALDLVRDAHAAARFLPRPSLESLRPRGKGREHQPLAEAISSQNSGWGNNVSDELQRWNLGETIGIIAGQQVCFAGGPLLILSKIASLLALRERFRRRGVEATTFFWLATEDHDYDEVTTLTLPGEQQRVLSAKERPPIRRIVGTLPIPPSLRSDLLDALDFDSEPRWLRQGLNLRDSFAELMTDVFRGQGMVFVDSLLPELRSAGRDLFRRIVNQGAPIEQALNERAHTLRDEGYAPQVLPAAEEHYTLFYLIDKQQVRQPIRRTDDGWSVGARAVSASDLLAIMDSEPYSISTSVLTRPLLQDSVLRPDVFVGGPSEVSYYAQIQPLHEMLDVPLPYVALRAHCLVTSSRLLRAVDRYQLAPDELFQPVEKVIEAHDPHSVERVSARVEQARLAIEQQLGEIQGVIMVAEPALQRSVDRTMRRIAFHLDKLGNRGRSAAVRTDKERFKSISRLLTNLAPSGTPQDRKTAWMPLLLQWGEMLPARMIEEAEPDADVVKVIGL